MAKIHDFNPGDIKRGPKVRKKPRRINAPFALCWSPERYRPQENSEGEYSVLPDIISVPIVGGANGMKVTQDEDGNITGFSVRQLDTELERRGLIRIPFDCTPDGRSYIRTDEDLPGVFFERFETVHASGDITLDKDARLEWMAWLIEEGHVDAPPVHVLSSIAAKLRSRLAGAQNIAARNPGHSKRVKELEAELAAVEKALGGAKPADTSTDVLEDEDSGTAGADPAPKAPAKKSTAKKST